MYRRALPSTMTIMLALLTAVALLLSGQTAQAQPFAPQGDQRLADSTNTTIASVELSQAAFDDGAASAVVIGRNDVFPDNLAGAGLTSRGPLLLTDPAPAGIPAPIGFEIDRVLAADLDCDEQNPDVYVLGGEAAVSPQVVAELEAAGHCVRRLGGQTRVQTAIAVADELLSARGISPQQPDRGQIFVARDDNPADSAAIGAWAARVGAPLVVTPGDALHPDVADFLAPGDTAFSQVTLLGGAAALSPAVQAQIQDTVSAFPTQVQRIAGSTRDDTAFAIAREIWPADTRRNTAIVNGFSEDFWTYALPGGAVAGRADAPLLYVQTDQVPPQTTGAYLAQLGVGALLTIGPDRQISAATQQAAQDLIGTTPPPGGEPFVAGIRVEGSRATITFNAASGGPLADPPAVTRETLLTFGVHRLYLDAVYPGANPRVVGAPGLITDAYYASDGTRAWIDIFATGQPSFVEELQALSNPARIVVDIAPDVGICGPPSDVSCAYAPADATQLGVLLTPNATQPIAPGPLDITGYASPFEAQASLTVTGPDGIEVEQGLMTAGWTEYNGTFAATVDTTGWAPGDYTITIADDTGAPATRTLTTTFTLTS